MKQRYQKLCSATLSATVLFPRLDIILISCIDTTNFIYLTTNRHSVQQSKYSLNQILKTISFTRQSVHYILHSCPFPGMTNRYI